MANTHTKRQKSPRKAKDNEPDKNGVQLRSNVFQHFFECRNSILAYRISSRRVESCMIVAVVVSTDTILWIRLKGWCSALTIVDCRIQESTHTHCKIGRTLCVHNPLARFVCSIKFHSLLARRRLQLVLTGNIWPECAPSTRQQT